MESPGRMAAVLRRAAARVVPELEVVVAEVLEQAKLQAQETIGVGDPRWPPFAEATQMDSRWGGPLYRSGDLRDSIKVHQEGLHGSVYSESEYIEYSELGTSHEAPRPLLKPALQDSFRKSGIRRMRFVMSTLLSGV